MDLIEFVTLCRACGADPEREVVRLVRRVADLLPPKRCRASPPAGR